MRVRDLIQKSHTIALATEGHLGGRGLMGGVHPKVTENDAGKLVYKLVSKRGLRKMFSSRYQVDRHKQALIGSTDG